jgi:hypothetical protein
MIFSTANVIALVIATSFAAGLNIYATILTLGLLARTNVVALPQGLDSLGHTWVLVACAIMFLLEFVADKIPAVDVLWSLLHTFVRIPVAALIAYHASAQLTPQLQLIAAAGGAIIALASHSSKTAIRAAITPSPEALSNITLSTVEDIVAVAITWAATQHPIPTATVAVMIFVGTFFTARALFRALRRPFRGLVGAQHDPEHSNSR